MVRLQDKLTFLVVHLILLYKYRLKFLYLIYFIMTKIFSLELIKIVLKNY